jgi:uncharacterized protein with HEPN domain
LVDIRQCIEKIDRYCADMDKNAFLADDKTQDAVARNLEVIGEAARHMPDAFKDSHSEIPWAQIAGLRNRIVHDYAGIDLEIIWNVVQHALPDLRDQISRLGDLP